MSNAKIISQKSVLKTKLFEVKELNLSFPNGETEVRHIAERHPTISVFPLTDKYEIYLVSQYRTLLKKKTLEAMAGFVEKGETTLQAAKRELKEETGITAVQWEELTRIELAASVFKAVNHLFLAKGLEIGEQKPDFGEEIEVIKMTLKEAVERVLTNEINSAASVIGILLLDKLRRDKKI